MTLTDKQREAISKAIDDHQDGALGLRYEVLDAIEAIVNGPGEAAKADSTSRAAPTSPAPAPLTDKQRDRLAKYDALRDEWTGGHVHHDDRGIEWAPAPGECMECDLARVGREE